MAACGDSGDNIDELQQRAGTHVEAVRLSRVHVAHIQSGRMLHIDG
jgi:hypothetical protein